MKGTEALGTYLDKHPQMLRSYKNEPHFFDMNCGLNCTEVNKLSLDNIKQIRKMYREEYFNLTVLENEGDILAFEKTPIYIFNPWVPWRVRKIVPWSKIIMLLRDPVERAYSAFKMNYIRYDIEYYKKEYGNVTFETCVEVDIVKLQANGILNETFWKVDAEERERRWLSYWNGWDEDFLTAEEVCSAEVGRGLYSLQIHIWLKAYNNDASRKLLFFIKSEALLPDRETKKVDLTPITDFIGIDELEIISDKKKIHSYYGLGPLHEDTRRKLQQIFDPFNNELLTLLGEEWKNPWPYNS